MAQSEFFNIDLILAEEEKVCAVFNLDCYNLESLDYGMMSLKEDKKSDGFDSNFGFSENSNPEPHFTGLEFPSSPEDSFLGKRTSRLNGDLERGSKVELPLWLALSLFDHNYISIQIPSWFGESFRQIALADPEVSNLKDKSLYFYEFGLKLADKIQYQENLFEILTNLFFIRMKKVVNLMLHLKEGSSHEFFNKMTELETSIYSKCKKSLRNLTISKKKRLEEFRINALRKRKRLKIYTINSGNQ